MQGSFITASLLLVTFTNRAAREMLHRAELLVKQETQKIWGGMFHHIANRLLRRYGTRIGIHPDFTILDREDAGDLMATCVTDVGVAVAERRFPQKNVLTAISGFIYRNHFHSLEIQPELQRRNIPFEVMTTDSLRVLSAFPSYRNP